MPEHYEMVYFPEFAFYLHKEKAGSSSFLTSVDSSNFRELSAIMMDHLMFERQDNSRLEWLPLIFQPSLCPSLQEVSGLRGY